MNIFQADEGVRRLEGSEPRTSFLGDYFKAVITEMPHGHAQNAHFHEGVLEVIFVLDGSIQVASWGTDGRATNVVGEGGLVSFSAREPHNISQIGDPPTRILTFKVIMPSKTVAHVKEVVDTDWIPFLEL